MEETKEHLQFPRHPISLTPFRYSDPLNNPLHSYFLERGPRYYAYAQLRESNLRSKLQQISQLSDTPMSEPPPPVNCPDSGKKRRSSVLAQSVPDFSSATRKENRRPPPENHVNQIPRMGKCGAPLPKMGGVGSSRSMKLREKQRLMVLGKNSYASIEKLKG